MYLNQIVVLLPFFTTFGHLNVVKLYIQVERELVYNLLFTTSMAASVAPLCLYICPDKTHLIRNILLVFTCNLDYKYSWMQLHNFFVQPL